MAQTKTEKEKNVNGIISDMLEHVPADKRDEFEMILRCCNFYSVEDPLFPIVLFLLFFQESIDDCQSKVAESLTKLENMLAETKGVEIPKTDAPKHRFSSRTVAEVILGFVLLFLSMFYYVKYMNAEKRERHHVNYGVENTELEQLNRHLQYNVSHADDVVQYHAVRHQDLFDWKVLLVCLTGCIVIGSLAFFYFLLKKKLDGLSYSVVPSDSFDEPDPIRTGFSE